MFFPMNKPRPFVSYHIYYYTRFAYVDLVSSKKLVLKDYTKRVIGSCCGKGRHFYFQQDVKTAKTAIDGVTITPENCLALMRDMQKNSKLFRFV